MKSFAPRAAADKTAAQPASKGPAMADNRVATTKQRQAQADIAASPRQQARQLQALGSPTPPRPNRTGLPDKLKAGVENLSGHSLDDVKVHYNSSKPAQLQAHAYAQGTDIHLGPGQEKHLPHEAWHVVQQKQGRVRAMVQMKGGLSLNDDAGLETEADVMGTKANKVSDAHLDKRSSAFILGNKKNLSIQLASYYHGGARKFVESAVKESHNAKKNTEGELGTGGMYYWKDDEDAAIISAFTYTNKGEEWSVMRIEISGKISEILLNAKFKVLVFRNSKDSPMSPGMDEDGKVVEEKYPGINYKMLQEYKKRKLSEITENDKRILEVKGENQHYKNCTGRQFMDKFDFIQAPTSGNYDLTELKQVKVNDEVLKKLIYPKKDKSNDFENQMAIIWEGQIDADKTDSVKRTYKLGSKNVGEELLIKSKDLNSGIKIKKISQKK